MTVARVRGQKKLEIVVPKNEAKKRPPPARFLCSVTLLVGPENGHTFRAQETEKKRKKVLCRGYPLDIYFQLRPAFLRFTGMASRPAFFANVREQQTARKGTWIFSCRFACVRMETGRMEG